MWQCLEKYWDTKNLIDTRGLSFSLCCCHSVHSTGGLGGWAEARDEDGLENVCQLFWFVSPLKKSVLKPDTLLQSPTLYTYIFVLTDFARWNSCTVRPTWATSDPQDRLKRPRLGMSGLVDTKLDNHLDGAFFSSKVKGNPKKSATGPSWQKKGVKISDDSFLALV